MFGQAGKFSILIRQHLSRAAINLRNHMVLMLIRNEKSLKVGIKTKRLRADWDNDYLTKNT